MSNTDNVNVCGFNIYSASKKECLDRIFSMDKVHVVSGNPEVLYTALSNSVLHDNFKSDSTVIIPDGVGVNVAAKLNGLHVTEKIAGVELMVDIAKRCSETNKSIYLLGAISESVEMCASNLKAMFPSLNVCGMHNGYFDRKDIIIKDIFDASPDVLFVALGCPKQEEFIISCMDSLPTSIFMGVGGSFDVISGLKKRAPKVLVSLGLEWAYRVYKEPFRIKRLSVIPKFLVESMKKKD